MCANSNNGAAPRYCIGIDLGTTNCVLSYVDSKQEQAGAQVLAMAQWDSATSVVQRDALPSFAYACTSAEAQRFTAVHGTLVPPVTDWVPGIHARNQMAVNAGRVIASAKSWLCHSGIDRTAPILPWQSEEVEAGHKLSPVQASAVYLRWMRQVWEKTMLPDHPEAVFAQQDIVITVPASFDEAAQELTLQAAHAAGYPEQVRLIEEPQAAFYFWLGRADNLTRLNDLIEASAGDGVNILVCDIGGGTTDLSLFEARRDKRARTGLLLKRVAVSDHLLLGGDNIDLTLAHVLEQKLSCGKKLAPRQWNHLLVQARDLKERILATAVADDETFTVTLSGSGAGLFASTMSAAMSAAEVRNCVLEGFFPCCGADDKPRRHEGGLKEWGLPYAADSAITRHLAAFVAGRRVDAVLFNGGSVTPEMLRQRLHRLLCDWQPQRHPVVLHNESISMAVARGAARYAAVLRGDDASQRIAGGYAHALYLEVRRGRKQRDVALVCILPQGLEAGQSCRVTSAEFDLVVNQPARFQCWYAVRRQQDRPGDVVTLDREQFRPLPPLETAVHLADGRKVANNRVRVTLEASLNELGLLQLYCVATAAGAERWRLDFNLRRAADAGGGEGAAAATGAEGATCARVAAALPLIRAVYAKKRSADLPEVAPKQLLPQLERQLGERQSWDSATLRALWPELAAGMTRKTRSVAHEHAWLYLAGYSLRPGYGVHLDEARMEQLWRLFSLGMAFPKEKRIQSQWYLLWRRVAGGLNAARQKQLFDKIAPLLRGGGDQVPELIYLVGALERLNAADKVEMARLFANAMMRERTRQRTPYMWALGRLLSRTPLYADIEVVVHPREVEQLFEKTAVLDWSDNRWHGLPALFALAARCTEQRFIDVDDEVRRAIVAKMRSAKAPLRLIAPVESFVPVDDVDREQQFGEALPTGLILVRGA